MRALILLALIVAVVPLTAQAAPPNYFLELESSLPQWSADSSLAIAVSWVAEQMPYLDSLRSHVLEISTHRQYHVDVICQHHDSKKMRSVLERQGVIDCQRQVVELLESLNGPVVVGEGWISDRIKQVDVLFAAKGQTRPDSEQQAPEILEDALQDYLDAHAVDKFVWLHPEARVYGFESPRLQHLNILLLHMRDDCRTIGCKRFGELTDFYLQLIRARSEVALVRLINRMDMKQVERGVIVIGSGHCEDFKKLAEQYNVTLSFHSADKPRGSTPKDSNRPQ